MYDVITFGSLLVDRHIYTKNTTNKGTISFPIGTKISINSLKQCLGGGGFNSARVFSTLGLKTGVISKIGSGHNSNMVLEELSHHKIHFLGSKSPTEQTGVSYILEADKGKRTILTYKGASNTLRAKELRIRKLRTRWLYLSSMSSHSFKTQQKIVNYLLQKDVKLAYNPSSYQIASEKKAVLSLIQKADVVSMNLEEAQKLIGSTKDVIQKILALGPKIVCITNGDKKGQVYDGVTLYTYTPQKVTAKETTGAGDTFASSLIAGIIILGNLQKAIKLAMANATCLVTSPVTSRETLNRKEALDILENKRLQITNE